MAIIDGNVVRCKSAADVLTHFPLADSKRIVVEAGTYSFSNNVVELMSGKHIVFEGDVVFDDCSLQTSTLVNTDYYADYDTSQALWSSPTFNKSGGGDWAAAAGWELFIRDTWYTRSASTTTTFTPNESVYAGGLGTNQRYILCLPTSDLYVEGSLRMTSYPNVAPLQLYGLANCNLANWRVAVEPGAASSPANLAYFSHCAGVRFPALSVSHFDFNGGGTYCSAVDVQFCQRCEAERWHVGNIGRSDATSEHLVGVRCYYCQDLQLNVNISGLQKSASDGDVFGLYLNNCISFKIDGQIAGLVSAGGDVYDWGETNPGVHDINLVWR